MHLRLPQLSGRGVLALRRGLAAACAIAVACSWLLLVGCANRAETVPDVTARFEVSPDPPVEGDATITVTLTGAGDAPLEGATVRLEGNMSHPGMKPVFRDAAEVGPGRYRAPFEFTMAGDWIITVSADLPDGRTFERQVDVRGVRSR